MPPGNLRWVADFMSRRRVRRHGRRRQTGEDEPSLRRRDGRHEHGGQSGPSTRAAGARNRRVRPAADAKLGVAGASCQLASEPRTKNGPPLSPRISQQHRGRCLILAGERQPAAVHLLAHALNQQLGNVGQTVFFTDPIEHLPVDRLPRSASWSGHRAGTRRVAGRPRRQSGLHRAGRFRFRQALRASPAAGARWDFTRTRRLVTATGTCPKRTTSKRGETRVPTMGRPRSFSR